MNRLQSDLHTFCLNNTTISTDKHIALNNTVNQLSAHGNIEQKNNSRFMEKMKCAGNTHIYLSGSKKKCARVLCANSSLSSRKPQPVAETVSDAKVFHKDALFQVAKEVVAKENANQTKSFSSTASFSDLPVEIVRMIFMDYLDDKKMGCNNLKMLVVLD